MSIRTIYLSLGTAGKEYLDLHLHQAQSQRYFRTRGTNISA